MPLIRLFFRLFLIILALSSVPWVYASDTNQAIHPLANPRPAPDFTLHDLDDSQHHLQQYQGKLIIVNFWATWCPPCRQEFPSMDQAYKQLQQDGIVMLAINIGEDSDTIFEFTSDYPVSFPILLDINAQVAKKYGVIGLPTSYIIDTQGRLAYQIIGTRDWTDPTLLNKLRGLQNAKYVIKPD